jgi:hypothetical protein
MAHTDHDPLFGSCISEIGSCTFRWSINNRYRGPAIRPMRISFKESAFRIALAMKGPSHDTRRAPVS